MDKAELSRIGSRFVAGKITSLLGGIRTQAAIVPPGHYFQLHELGIGMKPPSGKVWIRHENFNCYEVDQQQLTRLSRLKEIA